MRTTEKISITIDKNLLNKVEKIKEKTNVPRAKIINLAVKEFLIRQRPNEDKI